MEPGTQLGHRYQLTQRVGTGRLGEIWQATDDIFERTVTITVLHSRLSDDQHFRDDFRRDATAVAGLLSPHIIEVLDYSEEWRDGALVTFVVTEDLPTARLANVLTQEPLPVDRAQEVVAALVEAVDEAHSAQVVHGRISPHTVAFRSDTAVLVDFGTAAVDAVDESALPYLAPEQLRGEKPTFKSDIYALAATAYACLTGRPPFLGDTREALLDAVRSQAPPQVPKNCPPLLAAIITGALLLDPEHRAIPPSDSTPPPPPVSGPEDHDGAAEATPSTTSDDTDGSETSDDLADADTTAPLPVPEEPSDDAVSETAPLPATETDREDADTTELLPAANAFAYDAPQEPKDEAVTTTAGNRRNRKRRSLIVLAAVVVLIVVLLFVHPWQFFGGSSENTSDTSPAASGSSPATSTQSPDDSATSHSPRPTTKAPPPNNPTQLPQPTTTAPTPGAVPDVVGSPPSVAVSTLTDAQFNVARNETGAGDVECAVLMQDPQAGTAAEPGTTVTISYFRVYDERFCRQT